MTWDKGSDRESQKQGFAYSIRVSVARAVWNLELVIEDLKGL